MSDTHELDELLQRATAPHMHFDPATAIATGRQVRRRRRVATAGGALAAVTAVGIAVTAAVPGSAPALPAGPSQAPSTSSKATAATTTPTAGRLCFPSDSERGTPWASGSAKGSELGGKVVVEATVRRGCSSDVVGMEATNHDTGVTVMFRTAPTTAQWVMADAAVLFLPAGQRPCGYSFGSDLPEPTVLPQPNGWDLLIQPVPTGSLRTARESGTVDICRGTTVVVRGLRQVGGGADANLQSREPFDNPTDPPGATGCNLDNLVGVPMPDGKQWVDRTLTVPGAGRLTVDVQTHAGCTGEGHTSYWEPKPRAARLDVDVPAVPTQGFWDVVWMGADAPTGVFIVPPGQAVCGMDFSRSGAGRTVTLATPQQVSLANGWTLVVQPLPKADTMHAVTASFCTGKQVTTTGVVPSS